MRVSSIKGLLSNKFLLNTLEKISEHGTSFSAGTSLAMSLTVRPLAIWSTPDTEKENRQYAISNSVCSGLVKFGMVEAVAIPVENAVKNIDKNSDKFLTSQSIENFKGVAGHLVESKRYKLAAQMIKLGTGFLTAVPKSVLTVAFIPVIMDKMFNIRKPELKKENDKNISFKGNISNALSRQIAKILNNESVQKFAKKYELYEADIPKHITAATDILLTGTSVFMTNRSEEIKENRKKALIYNNVISTAITLGLGYLVDGLVKSKTGKFIEEFSKINAGNPKLHKYIEGINILRPALIFAVIYYGLLPIISTYMAEKIDKFISHSESRQKSENVV